MGSNDILDKFPYFLFEFLKINMQYFHMDNSETKIIRLLVAMKYYLHYKSIISKGHSFRFARLGLKLPINMLIHS